MASRPIRSCGPGPREKKALRSLEVRLLGISRDLGESIARTCRAAGVPGGSRRRLAFRPTASALPARRRLSFAPLPPEADRLVVTNWNPTPGVVVLGEVELELGPGESAALWINRAAPLPHTEPLEPSEGRPAPSFAFADGAAGPIL